MLPPRRHGAHDGEERDGGALDKEDDAMMRHALTISRCRPALLAFRATSVPVWPYGMIELATITPPPPKPIEHAETHQWRAFRYAGARGR